MRWCRDLHLQNNFGILGRYAGNPRPCDAVDPSTSEFRSHISRQQALSIIEDMTSQPLEERLVEITSVTGLSRDEAIILLKVRRAASNFRLLEDFTDQIA